MSISAKMVASLNMICDVGDKYNWKLFAFKYYKEARKAITREKINIFSGIKSEVFFYQWIAQSIICHSRDELELDGYEKDLADICNKTKTMATSSETLDEKQLPAPDEYEEFFNTRFGTNTIKRYYGITGDLLKDKHVQQLMRKIDKKVAEGIFKDPSAIHGNVPEQILYVMTNIEDEVFVEDYSENNSEDLMKDVINRLAYCITRYGDLTLLGMQKKEKEMRAVCIKAYEMFKRDLLLKYMMIVANKHRELNSDQDILQTISVLNPNKPKPERIKPNIFNVNRLIREENGETLGLLAINSMITAWSWECKRDIVIRQFDNEYKLYQSNIQIKKTDEEKYRSEIEYLKNEVEELKRTKESLIASAEETRKVKDAALNKAQYEIDRLKQENKRLKEFKEIEKKLIDKTPSDTLLKNEIELLRSENNKLKEKNTLFEQEYERSGELIKRGTEQELFPDEQYEILMDTINTAVSNLQENSRRRDVLQSILDQNKYQGIIRKRADLLRSALTGYTGMTAPIKRDLGNVGIKIESEKKHYKLTYHGDKRYMATLGKTPGDTHAGLNAANDAKNIMF